MPKLKKMFKWLDANLEPVIIVIFVFIMSMVVVSQVIMRYVFNNAFSWAEELTRYLFIWTIYVGISYSARTRRHIRVTFLIHRLPIGVQKVIILAGDFIFLTYLVIVVVFGIRLNINTFNLNQITAATGISYVFVYSSIVICSLLSSIRIIQNISNKLKNWKYVNSNLRGEERSLAFEKFLWIEEAKSIFHLDNSTDTSHTLEEAELVREHRHDKEHD